MKPCFRRFLHTVLWGFYHLQLLCSLHWGWSLAFLALLEEIPPYWIMGILYNLQLFCCLHWGWSLAWRESSMLYYGDLIIITILLPPLRKEPCLKRFLHTVLYYGDLIICNCSVASIEDRALIEEIPPYCTVLWGSYNLKLFCCLHWVWSLALRESSIL